MIISSYFFISSFQISSNDFFTFTEEILDGKLHFLHSENDQISIKKVHIGLQDKNYKLGWILDVALSILINKFVLSCFVKKILVYPFFVEGAGLPFFWSNAVNKQLGLISYLNINQLRTHLNSL